MKVRLIFVPPGGGEADYCLDFDLPSIPQRGDYIQIMRPGQQGTEDFIVRRTWWNLEYPDSRPSKNSKDTTCGKIRGITVECEFSLSGYSSQEHARAADGYAMRTGKLKEFEATAF